MNQSQGHILVVDDDQQSHITLVYTLEHQGYAISLAENGKQALEMLQTQSYDLILLDILMPEMNGYQVLEHMKNNNILRDIPVIVISAVDEMDSIIRCIRMGAEDYLSKPFNSVLLRARIGATLEKKRLRDQEQAYLKQLHIERERLVLLNRMGRDLTATLNLTQVIDRLLQAVIKIVGAEGASVWLWDKAEPGTLVCHAAFQQGETRTPRDLRLPSGRGIAGWVAQTGESVVVPYAPTDPRFSSSVDKQIEFRTTSLLAVALRARRAVVGVLELVNKQDGYFDKSDLVLVETLAASAAIAFDNAELIETLRRHTIELEARNEELDAFAHTVAHDLKNPVSTVWGFAETLEHVFSDLSQEQILEYLHLITQNGRKMNNIIDELLLLARVRKVEDIELMPLDMVSIVNSAQERITYLAEEYQAEIIMPDVWPTVLSYGPWIEEVWVNYLSNAIRYGGQPPRVELGYDMNGYSPELTQPDDITRAESDTPPPLRFWVRDNGLGLTAEEQARLFTPFTRLDQVRVKGHGLGLSIVRRIVEKLGGQVGVESQVGQGSIFSFTLPSRRTE
ncbi:MAG: response regulator [Chloroflexi bacterium]|nr:response regulator [Chloroflexota bacterium]